MRQIVCLRKGPVGVIGGVALFCAGLLGCSGIAHQSSPVTQEAPGPEDQHATVQSYYRQAEAERAEAAKYERRAASLGEYADPKGFVRSGLITAAETHRAKARNLEQLAATHEGHSDLASR
jgi:hypothetical protein